jgi:hypothetical protein
MQGQLFTQDFLERGIQSTPPWQELSDEAFNRFRAALLPALTPFSASATFNEAQTEEQLIGRVLLELGWGEDSLPQVNMSAQGREDVPDRLLFSGSQDMALAMKESRDERRYRHGLAILEAKRWGRPLDRGETTDRLDPGAPSSQMLRYLSRADVMSDGRVKWGILTNGAVWRLYWQNARSRSEEFFEIDLAAALELPGTQPQLGDLPAEHRLKPELVHR